MDRHILEGGISQYDAFIAGYNGPARSLTLTKTQIETIIGIDPGAPQADFISFQVIGNGELTCQGGVGFEDPDLIDYSGCFFRGLLGKHGDVVYEFTLAFDNVHQADTVLIKAGDAPVRYDFSNEHP